MERPCFWPCGFENQVCLSDNVAFMSREIFAHFGPSNCVKHSTSPESTIWLKPCYKLKEMIGNRFDFAEGHRASPGPDEGDRMWLWTSTLWQWKHTCCQTVCQFYKVIISQPPLSRFCDGWRLSVCLWERSLKLMRAPSWRLQEMLITGEGTYFPFRWCSGFILCSNGWFDPNFSPYIWSKCT